MDELSLKTFCLGELSNNCYLIFDKITKHAFIIDKPSPGNELDEFIKHQSLTIDFIALTHAHFDHISGLCESSIPFYIHRQDLPLLGDPSLNGSSFFLSPFSIQRKPNFYGQGVPLRFEKHKIDVIHTPGHTPGSVTLKLGNWLFSGDTLFFDSVGRTDVPLASSSDLIESIKGKILTLPADTIVYPGHGPSTTVGREKAENPFLVE